MERNSVQYTIRQIPADIDRSLRAKARQSRHSLNQAALEALARGLGLTNDSPRFHDLDELAGTWREDPEFERAIRLQDRVDGALWK